MQKCTKEISNKCAKHAHIQKKYVQKYEKVCKKGVSGVHTSFVFTGSDIKNSYKKQGFKNGLKVKFGL